MTVTSLSTKRILKGLIPAFLIFLILFVTLLRGMKGEPFEAAKEYISNNSQVHDKLGAIRNVSLDIFSSSYEFSGASGNAQYKIDVNGDKNPGVVYVDMEKQAGVWVVIRANLILADNSKIPL